MNRLTTWTDDQLEQRMRVALEVAWQGVDNGQSPFGAAIFDATGDLVVACYNQVKRNLDPSAHGEIMAIRAACEQLGSRQLPKDAWLFSTGEPCPMCAATIVLAGLRQVVYGASVQTVIEAGYSELQRPCSEIFKHASEPITIRGGVLEQECRKLLLENRS